MENQKKASDLKTLVVGASTNESRYSNLAIRQLLKHGHEVIAFGNKEGSIAGVEITQVWPSAQDIHTITMYLSPKWQDQYKDDIIGTNPHRVIFNPGTENSELEKDLRDQGIIVIHACTLVMLSTKQYALDVDGVH